MKYARTLLFLTVFILLPTTGLEATSESKEALLGEEHYKTTSSKIIHQNIDSHFSDMKQLCTMDKNLRRPHLQKTLEELKNTVDKYLGEPYIISKDERYLHSIKYMVYEESFSLEKILKDLSQSPTNSALANNFLGKYYSYYNVKLDDLAPEGIHEKHRWAQQMYLKLKCVQ